MPTDPSSVPRTAAEPDPWNGADPWDATVYAARLSPHRSLSPRGARVAMGAVGAIGLVVSVPFVLAGAWPVFGFAGLDVLLLWLAFRASFKQARAFEEVALTHAQLVLRRVSPAGVARQWRFNPFWVRLTREDDEEHGLRRLTLAEGRRSVEVGAFLDPQARERVAVALRAGLHEAKRGPTYNP